MKNTYILVKEGNNEQIFFSTKEAAHFLGKDYACLSNVLSVRSKHKFIVCDDKVYFIKKLPCGEPQYELQRKMNESLEVKNKPVVKKDKKLNSTQHVQSCDCMLHLKKIQDELDSLKKEICELKKLNNIIS